MNQARSFRSRLIWATACGLFAALALAMPFGIHMFRNVSGFMLSHTVLFGSLAAAFVLGGLWQIRKGLSEFNQLRANLAGVRDGREKRIEGSYPAEVQPLVDDLNALLDHREKAFLRAQAKAGDLAHGLKTPLALLSHEAERAYAAGQQDLSATIGEQVERMKRHVNYHLAQARAAASGATLGSHCVVSESLDALIRTFQKLHAERNLGIESTVSSRHAVSVQRVDLDEMLGNLLDNACRWARTRVHVSAQIQSERLEIFIEDDGPGLEASKRDVVLKRGIRSDESAPGHGLGLAIVRDLAELYGGTIELDVASIGGLRACLSVPRVSSQSTPIALPD
jgi:signal transduction histidine kinase